MQISAELRKQLYEALLAAFSVPDLARLLSLECNRELADYAPSGGDRRDVVATLLAAAEREDWLADLVEAAAAENQTNQQLQAAVAAFRDYVPADEQLPQEPPYMGLLAYDEDDAELFFGRDQLISELLQHVPALDDELDEREQMLIVIGASGSGKSSVVRAGMLPHLRRDGWRILKMRPGSNPVDRLAAILTVTSESVTATTTLLDDMMRDERSLNLYLQRSAGDGARTLLFIDQFEETFTQCDDPQQRRALVENLVAATAADGDCPLFVIMTMRADYYHRCADYDNLRAVVQRQQAFIGAMTSDGLRQVIERPAVRLGYRLQEGLLEEIMQDCLGVDDKPEPGILPLLSHALSATWQRRSGRMLTLAGYQAIGRVPGAIAQTAEQVYAELNQEQQQLLRRIFLRLAAPSSGAHDTRRRAAPSELLSATADSEQADDLLQFLADRRLIIIGEDGVEVAHEALIRHWSRLRRWLDDSRDSLRLQRLLAQATAVWRENPDDPSYLYSGARLQQMAQWADANPDFINANERHFLDAGLAEAQRRQDAVAEQQRRELESARLFAAEQTKRIETARRALAAAAVLLLLIAVLGLLAWRQRGIAVDRAAEAEVARTEAVVAQREADSARSESERQARLSEARSLAALAPSIASNDPADDELATLLALTAWHRIEAAGGVPDWLVDSSLRSIMTKPFFSVVIRTHEHWVSAVAFGPEGRLLASADETGRILLWDANDLSAAPTALDGGQRLIRSVAIAPNGELLAAASDDGDIRLWRLDTPQEPPSLLRGHTSWISNVAFAPDTSLLASSSHDGSIRLWDLSTPTPSARVLLQQEGLLQGLAFAADGRLASGGDTVRLWDIATGQLQQQFKAGNFVTSLAFDEQGSRLLTGSQDGFVRLWNFDDVATPSLSVRHADAVLGVAFDAVGSRIVSTSRDRTVRLWPLDGSQPVVLRGHQLPVWPVAVAPSGQMMATGSEDRTLRVWDIDGPDPALQSRRNGFATVHDLGFSAAGDLLLSGAGSGSVTLWSIPDLNSPIALTATPPPISVLAVAVDPLGRTFAAADQDGRVLLWQAAEPSGAPLQLTGHRDRIRALVFSADGTMLAAAGDSGVISIWTVSQPENPPQQLSGHSSRINGLAFDPIGRWLVSAGQDATLRLWEIGSDQPQALQVLDAQRFGVSSVAVSPDGRWLASGGPHVLVWDVDNLSQPPLQLRMPDRWTEALAFDPSGRWLAGGSLLDGAIRLWPTGQWQSEPIELPGSGNIDAVAFSEDGRWLASGDQAGNTRLWLAPFEELVPLACERVRRNLTWEEWQRYLPEGTRYEAACPDLPLPNNLPG